MILLTMLIMNYPIKDKIPTIKEIIQECEKMSKTPFITLNKGCSVGPTIYYGKK